MGHVVKGAINLSKELAENLEVLFMPMIDKFAANALLV